MTIKEQFEALPHEIVSGFLKTRQSQAIPEKVQRFILAIDKVPELHRRFPGIMRCSRELCSKYPELFNSVRYAQETIYAAIQYFHLNNTVSNAAWDNYYADKQDEIGNMAVKAKQFDKASVAFDRARTYRTNKDDNAIDARKLGPHTVVVSPDAPATLFDLVDENGKEPTLNELFKKKENQYAETVKFIDKMELADDEKERLKKEARLNLNVPEDTDYEEIDDH